MTSDIELSDTLTFWQRLVRLLTLWRYVDHEKVTEGDLFRLKTGETYSIECLGWNDVGCHVRNKTKSNVTYRTFDRRWLNGKMLKVFVEGVYRKQ